MASVLEVNIVKFDKDPKKRKARSIKKKEVIKGLSEFQIQKTFFEWLTIALPRVRELTFAIPNGGSRHKIEAINLKRSGVTPGVPDIFCGIENDDYGGLFIEFKAGSNKPTKEQKAMMAKLESEGYCCKVFWDWEAAKLFLIQYLKGTKYHV